jgi:hypothetical protein
MVVDLVSLTAGKFWLWSLLTSLLSLAAFYFSFRNLARARIIENTPTSRIRSAHQGYVELSGEATAMQGEPILSPLTFTPCCWYSYKVEHRVDNGWRTVRSGKSEGLFLIRDDSGECIIDPEGAEVTPREKNVWHGSTPNPSSAPHAMGSAKSKFHGMHGIIGLSANMSIGGNYRYTEESIYPGESLYAIGQFKSFGETDHQAMKKDQIKERLSEWKANPELMLSRFDRDGDGRIDMTEWEVARRAAKREVTSEIIKEGVKRLHTLSKTDSSRHPFLISSRPEFSLVKRHFFLAYGSMAAFFICGGIAVWMFTGRFI